MAISVAVPKNLSGIKTKVAMNLTKRQLICFGAAGAVGIVFDGKHGGGHVKLVALEVHQAILALVATADVAGGDAAVVIAATGFLEGSAETLFRGRGGDFVKGRPHLVTVRGSNWLE